VRAQVELTNKWHCLPHSVFAYVRRDVLPLIGERGEKRKVGVGFAGFILEV
jgi:hypothetical protein